MPRYEIVSATQQHVDELALTMREADVEEVWAAALKTPRDALQISMDRCDNAQTGLVDGEVACMFGVGEAHLLALEGVPWLLGSDLIAKHSKAFLRRNRSWVSEQKQRYTYLGNFVDSRNKTAIQWLRWLGFEVHPPQPLGPLGVPFHMFDWRP